MKALFKILVVIVVVLAVVLVVGILNLDKGVKAAVETVGPELTQSSVTLKDVDLSLTSGQGSLMGLVVGNPAGFKTEKAFSLGSVTLVVDPESVTTETIVIKTLHILAPEITYESGKGGSNIDQLQRNVEQALGGSGSSQQDAATPSDPGAAKKLIIQDLKITDGKISYSNPLLGGRVISVPLPPIHLTGIGEKSNGASAAEVTAQVLGAINKGALGAITQAGVLKNLGSGAVEETKDKVESALGGLKGLLKKD